MLVRIRPGAGDEPAEGGVVTVANPCLSGGEMEIFLEPRLPAPVIRVLGDSPIAHALAQLGAPLGFEIVPGGDPDRADAAVVVTAHGDGDEGRVEAALLAGVPYVGLVASPKRAAAVRDELQASGLCGSQLERLRSPAGLDIGSRTHAEVALSILAEIVARRARVAAAPVPPPPLDALVDPVCGMVEPPGADWPRVEHAGRDVRLLLRRLPAALRARSRALPGRGLTAGRARLRRGSGRCRARRTSSWSGRPGRWGRARAGARSSCRSPRPSRTRPRP